LASTLVAFPVGDLAKGLLEVLPGGSTSSRLIGRLPIDLLMAQA
jgi:hypothetical protein